MADQESSLQHLCDGKLCLYPILSDDKILKFGVPCFDPKRPETCYRIGNFFVDVNIEKKVPAWTMEYLKAEMLEPQRTEATEVQKTTLINYPAAGDTKTITFSKDTSKINFGKGLQEVPQAAHIDYRMGLRLECVAFEKDGSKIAFEKGHLAAAGNHSACHLRKKQTYKFTNCAPMFSLGLNQPFLCSDGKPGKMGLWTQLEEQLKKEAKGNMEMWICSGTVFKDISSLQSLPIGRYPSPYERDLENPPKTPFKPPYYDTEWDIAISSCNQHFSVGQGSRIMLKDYITHSNHAGIPTHFYKCVITNDPDKEICTDECYLFPNWCFETGDRFRDENMELLPYQEYRYTLEQIIDFIGYTPFPKLHRSGLGYKAWLPPPDPPQPRPPMAGGSRFGSAKNKPGSVPGANKKKPPIRSNKSSSRKLQAEEGVDDSIASNLQYSSAAMVNDSADESGSSVQDRMESMTRSLADLAIEEAPSSTPSGTPKSKRSETTHPSESMPRPETTVNDEGGEEAAHERSTISTCE